MLENVELLLNLRNVGVRTGIKSSVVLITNSIEVLVELDVSELELKTMVCVI